MSDELNGDALYDTYSDDVRELSTEEAFGEVYTNFKLHFYREIFRNFDNREATLTTVESFCMVLAGVKYSSAWIFSSSLPVLTERTERPSLEPGSNEST